MDFQKFVIIYPESQLEFSERNVVFFNVKWSGIFWLPLHTKGLKWQNTINKTWSRSL
jgi:hypothetical protein